jgi:cytoskeletal protein CcmA (bactofilin family)
MSGKFGGMFGGQAGGGDETSAGLYEDAPHEPPREMHTVLGTGCSVEGKLVCVGPARLDGDVNGEVVADDFLIIEKNATVTADLNVQELIVNGHVKGNITAVKRISLAPTAFVEGDIQTPSLTIKEGAQVKGKVDVAPVASRKPASEPKVVQPRPANGDPLKASA